MNDKSKIKLINIVMLSPISDSDKIEAVKKLTDSTIIYQPYYPYQPCPDTVPLFPPMWTGSGTTTSLCGSGKDLEIESMNGSDYQWFKYSNIEPYTGRAN